MMRRTLVLMLALAGFACGDDADAPKITLAIHVKQIPSDEPVEGLEVCGVQPDDYGCATSDVDGSLSLDVAAETDVLMRSSGAGSVPGVYGYSAGTAGAELDFDVVEPILVQVLAAGAGVSNTSGTGKILLLARGATGDGADAAGMTFALTGDAGDGPFYFAGSMPDPEQTETTDDGAVAWMNVPPGEYTITAAGAAKCETLLGFDQGADQTRVVVEADALTFVRLTACEAR